MKTTTIAHAKLESIAINNELFYKIEEVQRMRPFFMSIVSDSNHWLFVSSNGGISAGRKNAEFALFPYYTEDKIIDTAEITGSKTLIRIHKKNYTTVWEPFSIRSEAVFKLSRNIYQNKFGNKIIFEEINHDLKLSFQYEWNTSNLYGFVKQSRLWNQSNETLEIEIVDGCQNILPFGVPSSLQTTTSNLADAYKRSELVKESGLGIYALSAIIVDKAEPSEALKANIAWSLGLKQVSYLLSTAQLQDFRDGKTLTTEQDVKGEKGAYFVVADLSLAPGEYKHWLIVANVHQNHAAIIQLNNSILNDHTLYNKILADINLGVEQLQKLNASADGFQYTADELKDTRHFSNVLFNIMRGGIFDNNYQIEKWDFTKYLKQANRHIYEQVAASLHQLEENFSVFDLKEIAANSGNNDFIRLATEYLPLKFSRRHGDPSRPWNQFSINTSSEIDGSKILDYQGNWRDIFQNWEALAHAFPAFIEGMIYKFLNASTFDGYNPYRVTKDGFDWETIEPDNPWSYIGYWGDHQIIYLLKFLEFAEQHRAGSLLEWFDKNDFVYAHVPYRMKAFSDIVKNPKDTISFDHDQEKEIHERVKQIGADGALLINASNELYHVNFIEKILATLLSKLSNFIPEAGIWMNTQRPEWNDANNALVGNGVSMVTLYYLRRFLKFFQPILSKIPETHFELSSELHQFFTELFEILVANTSLLASSIHDASRKKMTDALGTAGSNFRTQIYQHRFSGSKKTVSGKDLSAFTDLALSFLEHSINANRRSDALYHAYNLMSYEPNGIKISHLSEMLEGQVSVLSSGYLTANESVQLLDALKQSSLYRKDQNSYILYPNKELPGFLQKNSVPESAVHQSLLLKELLNDGNFAIIEKDIRGVYHFNGNFRNAEDLETALQNLSVKYQPLVAKEKLLLLQIFEAVFNHKEFTGRSGTFYGYEGLGSIYWHMVSKLLLAVEETCIRAFKASEDEKIMDRLMEHYDQINDGIGVHKSPKLYGAFPTTPYSHTPLNRGAQQPGMTGQVKEDILCRIGELGVSIQDGHLTFEPVLLKQIEFLKEEKEVEVWDVNGNKKKVVVDKGSLLFSYCQTPVIYTLSDSEGIDIIRSDGSKNAYAGFALNPKDTQSVITRNGGVKEITVYLERSRLRN